ncbi:MAG: leucine-rich repeat protein [Lachnospiraceae bacterium]|nr:leucine-rich repeat protein [Lachnospiraceae bacterium]
MGDKTLRSYVIPKGTTEIGEWAFSGCKALSRVAIPSTVEHIGRYAFANCDQLKVASLYHETEEEEDDLAGLMAIALRYFKTDDRLITERRGGREHWLKLWDEACETFLDSPDEEGFRPFLAGGEEDYEDEAKKREEHCKMARLRKARAVYERLVTMEEGERLAHFQRRFRENDMAFKLLMSELECPRQAFLVYESAGLLTRENCLRVLNVLTEECVELKALLLQRVAAETQDFSLELI